MHRTTPQGSWHILDKPSDSIERSSSIVSEDEGCGKAIAITGIALLAIASLVAGGLLFHYNINFIAAYSYASYSLLGVGGGLLVADLIAGMIIYIFDQKPENNLLSNELIIEKRPLEKENILRVDGSYHIVTWNVGTKRDYSNMCCIKNKMNSGTSFVDAFDKRLEIEATREESKNRVAIFKNAFSQFNNPDIICLQETWQMQPKALQDLLPKGYTHYSCQDKNCDHDCTIVWNSEKFVKQDEAELNYPQDCLVSPLASAPDTILLLKDTTNGMTICVDSAHLKGFSLAYDTLLTKNEELDKAKKGDNQARYDLATMDQVQADLYVFAGDFNVTRQHYCHRLHIIEKHGYITDLLDTKPTIYDVNLKEENNNPKAAKLDHIYAKGGKNVQVEIKETILQRTELNNFNDRPSDHIPIGAKVSYIRV